MNDQFPSDQVLEERTMIEVQPTPHAPAVNPLMGGRRHRITVDGYDFHVFEDGQGPAVLLIHGFPNTSADWRHQVAALREAGYRVIAPDLLGLGDSDFPEAVEHYTVAKDTHYVTGILDALGIAQTHIICHDRGSGPGWGIATEQPERVLSLTSLTVGHLNAWAEAGLEIREKCWYMLFFQFHAAEAALGEGDFRLFRDWMRHHPSVDEWAANLARPGRLAAGLNWYRANANPDTGGWGRLPDVRVPTLLLWSPEDHYSSTEAVLNSYKYVTGPFRSERVDGAGHYMQLDRPAEVTRLILEFVSAR